MATNTLTDRSSGQTITEDFFNDLNEAFQNDFVGRDSSGVPASGKNLGTAAFPWGTIRANGLVIGGSSVDVSQVSAPPFRVVSGATRSTSNQPSYLVADGAAPSLELNGATTSLVVDINGTSFTLSADLTKGSLTTAPSTNNTALVNDTDAADQSDTRLWGEENPYATKKEITIDTVGSEITSLDGKLAAFKLSTEVFLARVDTTNNRLHKCYRGFFFDSSEAPIKRETLLNNDTITLMSLGWVFLDDDLTTIDVTYSEPTYSVTSPGSPATGDYWYDMGNDLWKRYDGATFQTVDRTYVGMVVLDSTNCIAARSEDFDKRFKADNQLPLEIQSTEIIRGLRSYGYCNVYGAEIQFEDSRPSWNITTDLAASADMYNASEQASTYYGLYLKDTGEEIISDIEPMMRGDLQGLYHPFNPWRFIGEIFNDGSSDITRMTDEVQLQGRYRLTAGNGFGSSSTKIRRYSNIVDEEGTLAQIDQSSTLGDSITIRRDGTYNAHTFDARSATTAWVGITVNTAEPTQDVQALASPNTLLTIFNTAAAVAAQASSRSKFLNAGDILRNHGDAVADSTSANTSAFTLDHVKKEE